MQLFSQNTVADKEYLLCFLKLLPEKKEISLVCKQRLAFIVSEVAYCMPNCTVCTGKCPLVPGHMILADVTQIHVFKCSLEIKFVTRSGEFSLHHNK